MSGTAEGRSRYAAIRSWRSGSPDPIRAPGGAELLWERRPSPWPGWLWCRDDGGRAGWVPEAWTEGRRSASTDGPFG